MLWLATVIKWPGSLKSYAAGDRLGLRWGIQASLEEWSLCRLSVPGKLGDFIFQPVLVQTLAAPALCLIGPSPVELCLSDMSVIIAAGAQAGVNPVSSATIIY